MKTTPKLITIIIAALLVMLLIGLSADAAYDQDTDYMALMVTAVTTGDTEAGQAAQAARNEKITALNLDYIPIAFEDLQLLAKVICNEAGSYWLTDEHQRLVAAVALNRVASPEFPDTLAEVIYQPGQYSGANSKRFANLCPDERTVKNALYVLENGSIAPASVVFQSEFRQGSGVYTSIYDKWLGTTYFCHSGRMELYGGEE